MRVLPMLQTADTRAELDALYDRRDKVERAQKLMRSFARVLARNEDTVDAACGIEDLASDLEATALNITEAINLSRAAA